MLMYNDNVYLCSYVLMCLYVCIMCRWIDAYMCIQLVYMLMCMCIYGGM